MTVAAAVETRRNHRLARVMAVPAAALRSMSCQIRDSTPPVPTESLVRSDQVMVVQQRMGVY